MVVFPTLQKAKSSKLEIHQQQAEITVLRCSHKSGSKARLQWQMHAKPERVSLQSEEKKVKSSFMVRCLSYILKYCTILSL